MPLHRLLYRSEANLAGTDADVQQQIAEIVAGAAAGNEAAGLTGALLYAGGMFVQALEGPPATVERTFERICCDHRHRRLELLEFVHAENRTFAGWSMARVTVDQQVARLITGVTIFDVPPDEQGMSAQAIIQLLRSLLLADLDPAASVGSPGPVEIAPELAGHGPALAPALAEGKAGDRASGQDIPAAPRGTARPLPITLPGRRYDRNAVLCGRSGSRPI